MTQLGNLYEINDQFAKSIKNLEHACMIYSTLESKKQYDSL